MALHAGHPGAHHQHPRRRRGAGGGHDHGDEPADRHRRDQDGPVISHAGVIYSGASQIQRSETFIGE
jgi:hypothetical protein